MDLQALLDSFNPLTFLQEALSSPKSVEEPIKGKKKEEAKGLIPDISPAEPLPVGWKVPPEFQRKMDMDRISILLDERNSGIHQVNPDMQVNASSIPSGYVLKPGNIDTELIRSMITLSGLEKRIKKEGKK